MDGLKLPLGSADRPGAGAYPLLVGVLLIVLSLSLLVQSVRRHEAWDGEEPFPRGADLERVVAVGLSLVLFVLVLKPLGYALSSALLMAATLWLLGQRNWKTIVVVSTACAVLSHVVFASLLGIPLPAGVMFD